MNERTRLATATLLVVGLALGFWHATSTPQVDEEVDGGEIEAAKGAVRAWGSFAATGDLGMVSPWFATTGPQYSQLQVEVPTIVPGGFYDFALSNAHLVGPGVVRGSVTVTGESGEARTFRWDIELVQQDGGWKVWTVRTSP